jgi:tetratricopeptide (TPR) repeat protein
MNESLNVDPGRSEAYSRLRACSLFFKVAIDLLLGSALLFAQSQNPGITAKFNQATEAMREGKLEEATAGFAAVVNESPSFAEAHLNLGLVLEEEGKHDDAIVSFRKALALKPRLRGANLFLGIAEFRLNQLDQAAAAVQRETSSYPKDAAAWMWLGIMRLAQERPDDAAEALDKAAKLKPDDQAILYHRGRAHLLVSKSSYAQMFKLNPDSWLVHRVLAQANSEAERHTDAVAEYEAAIKLAPTQPGLHEELGSEYRAVNRIADAEGAFQKELEIDPYNVLARYKLGAIEVEKGDGAKGKELLEAAQREKPDLVHLDYNLGRSEMLMGNDEAACEHFERTVKTDTDPEIIVQAWYQLGTAYRRLRRMDEARNAMATYQQLKDEAASKSQHALERYKVDHPNLREETPTSPNPQ